MKRAPSVSTSTDDRDDQQSSIFRVGEVVDVAISGATVVDTTDTTILVRTGSQAPVCIPVNAAGVTVARVAPAQWPPMVGDLWEDCRGDRWLCQQYSDHWDNLQLRMVPTDADSHPTVDMTQAGLLHSYGPVTLLSRDPRLSKEAGEATRPILSLDGPEEDHYAACQAETFASPHTYTGVREVGPDWEVCGCPVDDPIHQFGDEDVERGERS